MDIIFIAIFILIYVIQGYSLKRLVLRMGFIENFTRRGFIPFMSSGLKLKLADMSYRWVYLWWLSLLIIIPLKDKIFSIGNSDPWDSRFIGVPNSPIENILYNKTEIIAYFFVGIIPMIIVLMIANSKIYKKNGFSRIYAIVPHLGVEFIIFYIIYVIINVFFKFLNSDVGDSMNTISYNVNYFVVFLVVIEFINTIIFFNVVSNKGKNVKDSNFMNKID